MKNHQEPFQIYGGLSNNSPSDYRGYPHPYPYQTSPVYPPVPAQRNDNQSAQRKAYKKPGLIKYEMIFHWNYLDWDFPNQEMRQVFEDNQYWRQAMPAGIKVDQKNRYFCSVPRWAVGIPSTMNRIIQKGDRFLLEAFPSWEWNQPENPAALHSILGYEIDENNHLWMLDQGKVAFEPAAPGSQKLVIWDLNTNRLIDSIPVPEEAAPSRTSFLNDIVVDNQNGCAYITDSGSGNLSEPVAGAILVYNRREKTFRRVLDGHISTQDVPGFTFSIDNKPAVFYDRPVRIGADGIALSADRSTLYYCPVTGRNLYAINTAILRNFAAPLEEINHAVRRLGSKHTTTDGMHADNKGNLLYTMLEGKGIGIYTPKNGKFQSLFSDDFMLWVDGVAFDQNGAIIFNSNRLHQLFTGNQQDIDWNYPFNFIVWRAFVGADVKSYLFGPEKE